MNRALSMLYASALVSMVALPLFTAHLVAAGQKADVAIDFYRTLAESGSPDAQLVLGDLYRQGEGVPVDLVEAYAWYYLAAQQGVEEAVGPMNAVLRALPEAEWPLAKRRAESYERRYIPR